MPKIYIIAGEDSGDLLGSHLVAALQALNPENTFRGVGGDKLQSQGMELVAHVRNINFMGFWEVIKNLRTIRQLFRTVEADIQAWKPDAVIFIDYPGFNLRMAKFVHGLGIKVLYYISPQLWAWKKGRIATIKQYVDKMFVILPFEKDFYRKEGVEVTYVGHPLLDTIAQTTTASAPRLRPLIALLPGSRTQEIKKMLPIMLETARNFPDYDFVIAGAPSKTADFYLQLMGDTKAILQMNQTHAILSQADAALVTSGTATLETALFKVPQVVCYKGSPISYFIGKRLVQVRYISLVNLILDKAAVTELIQNDLTISRLTQALQALFHPAQRAQILSDYETLHTLLGNAGASKVAAKAMYDAIEAK